MASVTFSVGLLEKLAGLRKPEPPRPAPLVRAVPAPVSLPGLPGLSPEATRLLAQEKQLARQLQATKEVAGLLVKQEATEVAAMQAKAEQLLRQYGVSPMPEPCQAESQACSQCFREHAKEAWRCQAAAEAYRTCSIAAFNASSVPLKA